MGIPTRHSGYPYQDGETLAGADLETDIANVFESVSDIENAQVNASADIAGSKLADNTVTNAKLTTSTITTAKMAQGAIPQAFVQLAGATSAMTTSTSWVDVPDISSVTLTDAAFGDMIFCDLSAYVWFGIGASDDTYKFGFSIDGTDSLSAGWILGDALSVGKPTVIYAASCPASGSVVVKPRYKMGSASGSANAFYGSGPDYNRVFRVLCIPTK